jgi:hypothetical protein
MLRSLSATLHGIRRDFDLGDGLHHLGSHGPVCSVKDLVITVSNMFRNVIVALNLLFLSTFSPVIAQRGGPSRGNDSGRGGGLLPAGTMLPTISAFDEQGEKFSTSSLRGSYTVLVFGCLT